MLSGIRRSSAEVGPDGVFTRMYTDGNVRTVVTPIALFVVLLSGTLPLATIACQLACSSAETGARTAHDHHSHGASIDSDSSAAPMSGAPALQPIDVRCDHSSTIDVGVITLVFKMSAPSAVDVTDTVFLVGTTPSNLSSPFITSSSPPGSASARLSLRI